MRDGLVFTVSFPFLLAGCAAPPADTETGRNEPGVIVVGITSDFVPGADIARIEGEITIDGGEVRRMTWSIDGDGELAFPIEVPLEDLPDGARVDVRLAAFETLGISESPFVVRRVATAAVAGQKLLLRTHLEWECVPGFKLGGEHLAPTCPEPETCVAAECEDPYVQPDSLEAYSATWMAEFSDACRPLEAGPPELTIGEGLDTFSALTPGGDVPMHLGNQGGYHVWLALRMRNLHQVGSTTTLTVALPSTGEELCSVTLPRDFSPATNGACDLVGIQCIVLYDATGLQDIKGQTMRLSAKVVDITGDVCFAEQEATLVTQR